MRYVLDAHILVWYLEDDPRLTAAAAAVLDDPAADLLVPTIALAEIAHRRGRDRVGTSLADALALVNSWSNAVVAPFDMAVLNLMPTGLEIHDAIVVATALVHAAAGPIAVVTNDRQITRSGLVGVVW